MYKIVAFISYFIRMFYIPNPFESIDINELVRFGPYLVLITPDIINAIVGGIMGYIVYIIVGLLYNGSAIKGSVLYLMIYTIFNIVIAGVYEVGVSDLTIMVAVVIVICSVYIINRCLDKIGSLVNVT